MRYRMVWTSIYQIPSEATAVRDRMNCPSAQPNQDANVVIGVVGNQDGMPRVSLLPKPVPLQSVTHLIPDTIPIAEVLRLAAPCAERRCAHFSDNRCTLASRIVARLPAITARLSPCAIRPSCRWWHQEGPAACHRCPQIITEPFGTDDLMREVATPTTTHATQEHPRGALKHVGNPT
jgi:hypothetical protein